MRDEGPRKPQEVMCTLFWKKQRTMEKGCAGGPDPFAFLEVTFSDPSQQSLTWSTATHGLRDLLVLWNWTQVWVYVFVCVSVCACICTHVCVCFSGHSIHKADSEMNKNHHLNTSYKAQTHTSFHILASFSSPPTKFRTEPLLIFCHSSHCPESFLLGWLSGLPCSSQSTPPHPPSAHRTTLSQNLTELVLPFSGILLLSSPFFSSSSTFPGQSSNDPAGMRDGQK